MTRSAAAGLSARPHPALARRASVAPLCVSDARLELVSASARGDLLRRARLWSLVGSLLAPNLTPGALTAHVPHLLERHGILTRDLCMRKAVLWLAAV